MQSACDFGKHVKFRKFFFITTGFGGLKGGFLKGGEKSVKSVRAQTHTQHQIMGTTATRASSETPASAAVSTSINAKSKSMWEDEESAGTEDLTGMLIFLREVLNTHLIAELEYFKR